MDSELITSLQTYGFSDKEARIYLTCLELGSSLASTIARRAEINRGTAYSILEDFKRKGIANESIKDELKYFSVLSPELLFKREEERYENMKSKLPDLMAVTSKYGIRPRTQFFEGQEGLKNIYQEIILHGGEGMGENEPYLTFTGTGEIDQKFQDYLTKEFVPWRSKFPRPTKTILVRGGENAYTKYHIDSYDTIIVDDPLFNFADEMMVYGKDKVAIVMYTSQEMCGLIVTSATLHDGLKSMFNLIRKFNQKKSKKHA